MILLKYVDNVRSIA